MIRVVIADDQRLVREGFRAILDAETDITVVAVSANGAEAVRRSRELSPDVVIMDVRMPEMDGIDATREIVRQRSAGHVLVLTTFDLDDYVYEAMKAGASGFLLKDAPPGRLGDALRTVVAGETLIDPAVARRLVERFVRRPAPGSAVPTALHGLSERELDVLKHVARGRSNAEVAAALHLSPATVKTHVASLLRKLDIRDRVQAVIVAYESGLVEPGHQEPRP